MSFVPTQPVGGRVSFQSQLSAATGRGHGDLLTPTRHTGGAISSPFGTALRRNAPFGSGARANPFTPRVDRELPQTGTHMLGRRSTASRDGHRSSLHQAQMDVSRTPGPNSALRGARSPLASASAEYPVLGGVGGWPTGNTAAAMPGPVSGAGLASSDGALGAVGDQGPKSPFSRPKSPAPRSASPHRNSKKLPSFLLGSVPPSKSPVPTAPYSPDPTQPGSSTAATSMFGLSSAHLPGKTPLSARPTSPHVPRRLSGFGSNDMLSSAYRSSSLSAAAAPSRSTGPASSLDDAPPIMTLDDMDVEKPDGHAHGGEWADRQASGADIFGADLDTSGSFAAYEQSSAAETKAAGSEQDYEDVKVRSVVVSDLPARSESSTLNYFRSFGEVLAFSPVATAANSLAILFSEPWQAQRAIAQGDGSGRILLDDRILARVDWADAASVSALFKQVFPGHSLPKSAMPPEAATYTFSQTIYAQSPRKQAAASPQTHRRSRIEAIQESETRSSRAGGGGASPFRQRQKLAATASSSTSMAAGSGVSGSASAVRAPTSAKPRNGLVQSALDILFGW
ncbi:hypothetical protein GGF46_000019 [Coemansia sp. RSA 552]|nr:hypothetical protein GGF46_000019 [Coemansia sp. RSA 552]